MTAEERMSLLIDAHRRALVEARDAEEAYREAAGRRLTAQDNLDKARESLLQAVTEEITDGQ